MPIPSSGAADLLYDKLYDQLQFALDAPVALGRELGGCVSNGDHAGPEGQHHFSGVTRLRR